MAEAGAPLSVEVVWIGVDPPLRVALEVPAGATRADALEASGIAARIAAPARQRDVDDGRVDDDQRDARRQRDERRPGRAHVGSRLRGHGATLRRGGGRSPGSGPGGTGGPPRGGTASTTTTASSCCRR